jgi:hypothetical protein
MARRAFFPKTEAVEAVKVATKNFLVAAAFDVHVMKDDE